MTRLKRGMVIGVKLDPVQGSESAKTRPGIIVTNDVYNERVPVIQVVPVTPWRAKKARIKTSVALPPDRVNGLSKKSIADCLQARPIDHRRRLARIRGQLSGAKILELNAAFKAVFEIS